MRRKCKMNIKLLKKLARSNKYQLLYSQAKELSNLRLFNNEIELSKIQLLFLNWLSVYNMLLTDLANKEKYISEEVINDDLRTEAYLVYKEYMRNQDGKPNKKTDKLITPDDVPTLIFTSDKKGRS